MTAASLYDFHPSPPFPPKRVFWKLKIVLSNIFLFIQMLLWCLYVQNFINVDYPTKFQKFSNFWAKHPKTPQMRKNVFHIFFDLFWKFCNSFPKMFLFAIFCFWNVDISVGKWPITQKLWPRMSEWSNAPKYFPQKVWSYLHKNWREQFTIWNPLWTYIEVFLKSTPNSNFYVAWFRKIGNKTFFKCDSWSKRQNKLKNVILRRFSQTNAPQIVYI